MLYLLLVLILATLIYLGWRAARAQMNRPKTRVIGPTTIQSSCGGWGTGTITVPR